MHRTYKKSKGNGSGNGKGEKAETIRPGVIFAEQRYTAPMNKLMLELGQWTDDAAMGLALADSLLSTHSKHLAAAASAVQPGTGGIRPTPVDGSDMRSRFHAWWNHGYCTPFPPTGPFRRPAVGLGTNIKASLAALVAGQVVG